MVHQQSVTMTERIDLLWCMRSKAVLISSIGILMGNQIVDVDLAFHIPIDNLGDVGCGRFGAKLPVGTFYFQVRHANDFNGFTLEILACRIAICSSPCPIVDVFYQIRNANSRLVRSPLDDLPRTQAQHVPRPRVSRVQRLLRDHCRRHQQGAASTAAQAHTPSRATRAGDRATEGALVAGTDRRLFACRRDQPSQHLPGNDLSLHLLQGGLSARPLRTPARTAT
ncbi:hypothetical protein EV128_13117 [Rhizobium azibense]|nr:hypothetical protein EV128_13117 [Rhizobium azibense]